MSAREWTGAGGAARQWAFTADGRVTETYCTGLLRRMLEIPSPRIASGNWPTSSPWR